MALSSECESTIILIGAYHLIDKVTPLLRTSISTKVARVDPCLIVNQIWIFSFFFGLFSHPLPSNKLLK